MYILLWEHEVLDQEALYARVIGFLVQNKDLYLPNILSNQLAAYPPSMFYTATGKSNVKEKIQVEVSIGSFLNMKKLILFWHSGLYPYDTTSQELLWLQMTLMFLLSWCTITQTRIYIVQWQCNPL